MTNAFKYGALSTKKGFVSLTWTIDVQATGSILTVDWHEHGGPKVLPTSERVNDFAPLEVMSLVSNRAAARA